METIVTVLNNKMIPIGWYCPVCNYLPRDKNDICFCYTQRKSLPIDKIRKKWKIIYIKQDKIKKGKK